MESSLVIKVNYGDTLRRFSVQVDEDDQLDLDMVRLRAKIISLFNFTADANLMLKYVDEDGDLVTLVDDDDLHDVMRQRLKFLKIEVHMSNDSDGKSNAMSSGSATPLRSSPVPNPFLNRNAATADGFKSLPEPLLKALSNLSLELASKAAASSSPVLATLADPISRMGQSLVNSDSQSHGAAGPSTKKGVPEEPVTPESRDSKKKGVPEELVTPESRDSQSKYVGSTSNPSQQVEAGNVTRGVVAGVAPVDLNVRPCDPNPSQSPNLNTAPLSSAVPSGNGGKGKTSTDDGLTAKGDTSGTTYTSYAAPNNSSTQTTAMGSSAFIGCPFSGTYNFDSVVSTLGHHRLNQFKRGHSHAEAMGGTFHKGIQCDGCGVYPITGPRFKSKVKDNYDLCSICFNQMGIETDYIRMDRPVSVCSPLSFKGGYEQPPWRVGDPTLPPWRMGNHPTLPHNIYKTGGTLKHARSKLDSRFVLDVNVMDGAMMAPSTVFTKIWRMRNNGTSVWPKGTQLVWIGGDKFSDSHSVDLEVPQDGVPVGKELDIAVDFRAPQLPGRYISTWRMASPSGKEFGQHVWVLIQVDASLKGSFYDSSRGLNLNIPLDVNGSKGPQIIDINVQPIMDDGFLQPHNPSAPTEPVKQMDNERPRQEMENKFAINEATVVGHGALPRATSVAPTFIDHGTSPIIDFSETVPAVPSSQQSSAVDALSSSLGIDGSNSVEERLLKKLEEMGFKQVDLNKEILRMNEYNLEKSLDDLCGIYAWNPIVEDYDYEMEF